MCTQRPRTEGRRGRLGRWWDLTPVLEHRSSLVSFSSSLYTFISLYLCLSYILSCWSSSPLPPPPHFRSSLLLCRPRRFQHSLFTHTIWFTSAGHCKPSLLPTTHQRPLVQPTTINQFNYNARVCYRYYPVCSCSCSGRIHPSSGLHCQLAREANGCRSRWAGTSRLCRSGCVSCSGSSIWIAQSPSASSHPSQEGSRQLQAQV